MLKALLLAVAVATVPATELSPEAGALVAPVHEAIAKTRAELDALPPPKDDAERLVRMRRLDQAPRKVVVTLDFSKLPAAQRAAAQNAVAHEIMAIDAENEKTLLAMLPPEGWFSISRYGPQASTAAFLIVQHSDAALRRRFVPIMESLAAKGEVAKGEYALMYDRLALEEGRPQRYGSQMTCKDGRLVLDATEDPEHLDARRAAMDLPPEKDNLAIFAAYPPC
ncbi:MAG: hypothetical protein E7812_15255 [Phenylobacterium sp.]|nr:MAG: hypothetical protein E7812_15255 [Phenylobacterium sp.]